jgi:hypothetical protein
VDEFRKGQCQDLANAPAAALRTLVILWLQKAIGTIARRRLNKVKTLRLAGI